MAEQYHLLTANQVAERHGVTRKTVQLLYQKGDLRCVRFGGSVRFTENDYAAFIASHSTGS